MKLKVYCVYDSKSEGYGTPLFYDCRANAIRSLQEAVNESGNERNQLSKYPADFTFFEIGEYDRSSGIVTMYESKVNLGLAIEYKKTDLVSQN